MAASYLATRNRLLKDALVKAGFSLEFTKDIPLGDVIVAEHKALIGQFFIQLGNDADFRKAIQVGVGADHVEAQKNARPGNLSLLRTTSYKPEAQGNACVWILAPGAKYIARGYGFHLAAFVKACEDSYAARQAAKEA